MVDPGITLFYVVAAYLFVMLSATLVGIVVFTGSYLTGNGQPVTKPTEA